MMNRRSFLKLSALASGGLFLGIATQGCAGAQVRKMEEVAAASGGFRPNAFITITPDDRVLLAMDKAEMGQGVMTSHAMLVAEELEIPMESIEPFHAGALDEFRTSVGEGSVDTGGHVGMQITGGSSSMSESFYPVREAAASARVMLVAAAAKKWGVPAKQCVAREGKVHHKASGKSLSYGSLTRLAAQEPIEVPPLKAIPKFEVIGKDKRRIDARSKVDGSAIFGADVQVPDMVKACILHPPNLGGQATVLDDAKARQVPGVVDIFSFERGVAVVAEKFWQAQKAARLVKVEWDGGILQRFSTEKLRKAAKKRVQEPGMSIRNDGDAETVFGESSDVLDVVYETPYLAHAPMEPQNCTVSVKGDKATIWAPVQSPTLAQEIVGRILDVPRGNIEVHTTMLGGGFGRRLSPDYLGEATLISQRVKRPVQVIWSREDDTQQGYYRPLASARMRGSLDAEGNMNALSYRCASQQLLPDQTPFVGGMFADWIPVIARRMIQRSTGALLHSGSIPDMLAVEGAVDTPYGVPNVSVEHIPVRTKVPVAFWRSVGHSYNGFVMESFLSEMAHKAGKDPVEFRKGLLKGQEKHLMVLEKAAELGEWGKPAAEGFAKGVAVHKSFHSYCAHVIEAGVVRGKIVVRRVSSAIYCGLPVNPDIVKAQVESAVIFGLSAALMQEITMVNGQVQEGNFDSYPILRMFECPEIEVEVLPSREKPTGVGEPGLPPVAAALANAIFNATGVRLRKLPLQNAWDEHQKKGGAQ